MYEVPNQKPRSEAKTSRSGLSTPVLYLSNDFNIITTNNNVKPDRSTTLFHFEKLILIKVRKYAFRALFPRYYNNFCDQGC